MSRPRRENAGSKMQELINQQILSGQLVIGADSDTENKNESLNRDDFEIVNGMNIY